VGNITLGGTGKTPLIIYLVELLKKNGCKPGVISRGYGGKATSYPLSVTAKTNPAATGDEPLLIHLRTKVPVVVDPKRNRAAAYLIEKFACDIVLSDDGLQHYPLKRDMEIAVIDDARQFGNGLLFPAGPLREPQRRLKQMDFIVINGENREVSDSTVTMQLMPQQFVNLKYPKKFWLPPTSQKIIALAGIGNPKRFFKTLANLGIVFEPYPFPDHHVYHKDEPLFQQNAIFVMTEKDAVKCQPFATESMWYLPVTAQLSSRFDGAFLKRLNLIKKDVAIFPLSEG
jgi:tetraacyldisaccharide 4'-kinase